MQDELMFKHWTLQWKLDQCKKVTFKGHNQEGRRYTDKAERENSEKYQSE